MFKCAGHAFGFAGRNTDIAGDVAPAADSRRYFTADCTRRNVFKFKIRHDAEGQLVGGGGVVEIDGR
mgnify:CR=1 FL=1